MLFSLRCRVPLYVSVLLSLQLQAAADVDVLMLLMLLLLLLLLLQLVCILEDTAFVLDLHHVRLVKHVFKVIVRISMVK